MLAARKRGKMANREVVHGEGQEDYDETLLPCSPRCRSFLSCAFAAKRTCRGVARSSADPPERTPKHKDLGDRL